MPLRLHLPADIERAVRERARAVGVDVETYVSNVIKEDVADTANDRPPASRTMSYAERLQAWIALHPVLDRPIDDSRESIYAGRGE